MPTSSFPPDAESQAIQTFLEQIRRLPADCRYLNKPQWAVNMSKRSCVLGTPGRVDLTPASNAFYFYLGADCVDLIAAFTATHFPQQLRLLAIGNSSYRMGNGLDYRALLAQLANIRFPQLRSLSLGVWELFSNSHCGYGKLGDMTALLQQLPQLTELSLYGNFELTVPLHFPYLQSLTIVQDDPVTCLNGGPLSQQTLSHLLNSEFPLLRELELDLELYENPLSYQLPDDFVHGRRMPCLQKLELGGQFAVGEIERFSQGELIRRTGFTLHLNTDS